ncbi:MAG: secretion protein, partial [Paramuribaculum sp.]|nr:secretion protein [Paramuribaculum sp.]
MKKNLLLLSGMLAASGMVQAQSLQTGYVTNPESAELHTYINAWNDGKGNITIDSKTWEDEEFYTSRVKPRTRIERYGAGDVNNLTAENDKRIMWWVPIGDPSFWAIPNAQFDSEVFSCWSYIDHFGSFSNPYGWVDGAFADVAHKNGVAVSGVASVPQGSVPQNWTNCFNGLGSINSQDQTKVPKFLLYHGVDGLTYNSEWSTSTTVMANLNNTHAGIVKYFNEKGIPTVENLWYDGTTDGAGNKFDSFLSNQSGMFKDASMFSNYNWNSNSLDNVPSRANSARPGATRAPFYYYAGCNMQGGEPKNYTGAYSRLQRTGVSIGYWGAHTRNMFWEGRGAGGTSALARQQYYLDRCEKFFTNGVRNPAVHLSIIDRANHHPDEIWHGVSTFRNAASAINHTIANEAFYTFFNLGNGTFFNWKGQRLSDNEWYSLGIQDYMPTWRFWFAPTFMASTVTKGSQGLQADFIWDDAYVGGSCLKISGSASTEYLH